MIRIVNLRNYKPTPNEILIKVDRSNKVLGNQFIMHTEDERELVCNQYKNWFSNQIENKNETVLQELRRIYKQALQKDIALGCWCFPMKCHAETIKSFLEEHLKNNINFETKLNIQLGDILSINKGAIVHQVNNCGKMARGLASHIRKKYPSHYTDYMTIYNEFKIKTSSRKTNIEELLGSIVSTHDTNVTIYGCFSQDGYGTDKRYTNYNSFRECLKEIRKSTPKETPIYIPYRIGCGLAGGDWSKISKIIYEEIPHSIIIRPTISSFRGQHFFLSNLFTAPVTIEGLTYPCNESAFQALKTLDVENRRDFLTIPVAELRKRGRKLDLRKDWEQQKYNIMTMICRQKFIQNPELKTKLIQTNPFYLQEVNTWGDTEWGIHNGSGQNKLGKILMQLREEFIKQSSTDKR